MSKLIEYLKSRIFWKNVLYAAGILLFILIFTATCTRFYTHHKQSYAVPDLTNMPLVDAVKVIEGKDLRYQIFDSFYVPIKDPGTVLDQHPKPGFLVKKDRTIFLTINSSAPEKIAMPNLVGITLREGKARLESYGLLLGILSYKYDISKNVILEQRSNGQVINPGDSISKGSFVDLVLGKGLGNENDMVPNLIGLTVDQAKLKLADAMFSLGATVPDGSYDTKDPVFVPFIYKQKPVSNKSVLVPLGSTITVWVSVDSLKLPGVRIDENGNYTLDNDNDENPDSTHSGTTISN